MSDKKLKILGLSGSLRAASYNRSMISAAVEVAPDGVELEVFDGVGGLPLFSEELEGELTPSVVEALRRRIREADGVLISTPEYNGGVPGVLKNVVDWGSRPYGQSSWAGKPVAVVGASISPYGAQWAQESLIASLKVAGGVTIGEAHPFGPAGELFDERGRLADDGARARLRDAVEELVETIEAGLARDDAA